MTATGEGGDHMHNSDRDDNMRRSGLTWEERVVGIVLCALVMLVAVQVLSRYLLHQSLSYTEEIVRYGFVWITFLGAAAAAYRGRHLSLEGTSQYLPAALARAGGKLAFAGAVVFSTVLILYGARVVVLQFNTGQTTAAMGLPMWLIGLAAPVCAAALLARLIMAARRGKGRG